MEYFIGALVLVWVLSFIFQGYRDETLPPLPTVDDGHGGKVAICPACGGHLTTVQKSTQRGAASLVAVLFGICGIVVIFFNILVGAVLLILAILISQLGKGSKTSLVCTSCGKTARTLT